MTDAWFILHLVTLWFCGISLGTLTAFQWCCSCLQERQEDLVFQRFNLLLLFSVERFASSIRFVLFHLVGAYCTSSCWGKTNNVFAIVPAHCKLKVDGWSGQQFACNGQWCLSPLFLQKYSHVSQIVRCGKITRETDVLSSTAFAMLAPWCPMIIRKFKLVFWNLPTHLQEFQLYGLLCVYQGMALLLEQRRFVGSWDSCNEQL